MTTRREHLESILGDFNTAFSGLGVKFGAVRQATALYLEPWTVRETLIVATAAVASTDGLERDRLADFVRVCRESPSDQPYGDLAFHPLFLQFILEDVAEYGVTHAGRTVLMKRWVERKIRRDREPSAPGAVESRAQIDPRMDSDEYVERIMAAMMRLAYEMSAESGGAVQLLEGVPSDRARLLVQEVMHQDVELLPMLLNSVLTTLGPRRGANVPVGFALRVLHEYFAAAYIVEKGLDLTGWPSSVQDLAKDLRVRTF